MRKHELNAAAAERHRLQRGAGPYTASAARTFCSVRCCHSLAVTSTVRDRGMTSPACQHPRWSVLSAGIQVQAQKASHG